MTNENRRLTGSNNSAGSVSNAVVGPRTTALRLGGGQGRVTTGLRR